MRKKEINHDAMDQEPRHEKYIQRLYISGMTPRSSKAIANIKRVCEKDLKNRYRLDIIDIYQQPELARRAQIVATPTLIKKLPFPFARSSAI